MDKLEQKLANENEKAANSKEKEAIMEKNENEETITIAKVKSEGNHLIVEEKKVKVRKTTPRTSKKGVKVMKKSTKAPKTKEKEVDMNKDRARAIAILQKVAKVTKGVTLGTTGLQIRDNLTGEVKCCIRHDVCKVTMPLKAEGGIRSYPDNLHMSRVPFGHKDLEKIFKKRLSTKKTATQFEKEIYDGPSLGRQRLMNKVKGVAKTPKDKLKLLVAKEKALKAEIKTLKAIKITKVAKTTNKVKETA